MPTPPPPSGALGVERALAPLDALRRLVLAGVGRPLAPILARREPRVTIAGLLAAAVAFALATTAPLVLLALGPLLLGVPHLVADLRHLVLRPGLARRPGFVPLVLLPLGATLLVPRLPLGLAAVVGACLVARASLAGRALGAAGALVLVGAAAAAGRGAELAFAHAHNLVALALWWTWRPRRPAHQLLPLAAFALGGGAILSGLTLPWTLGATPAGAGLAPLAPGLDVAGFAAAVVPAVGPDWTVRLLVFFAFAQSVHYGVWVRLVPEDDRPRPGLRSFASSYRALRADCGGPLLAAAALIALGVLAAGLLDPAAARDAYLRVAFFHGPLEIAIIALRLVERAAPPS